MLIYRQFKKELIETETQLANFKISQVPTTDPTFMQTQERAVILNELNKYVDSFAWVKTSATLEKVQHLIASNFNYGESASHFGTSVTTLRVAFTRADKNLKKRIELPLTLLKEGKLTEALQTYQLSTRELTLSDYHETLPLLNPVVKLGFKKPVTTPNWLEATNALKFIKVYSKPQLARGMERSGDLLTHILYILLSGDPSCTYEKEILIAFLNGEIPLEKVIEELSAYQDLMTPNQDQEYKG